VLEVWEGRPGPLAPQASLVHPAPQARQAPLVHPAPLARRVPLVQSDPPDLGDYRDHPDGTLRHRRPW
jgi:hypothetical protein